MRERNPWHARTGCTADCLCDLSLVSRCSWTLKPELLSSGYREQVQLDPVSRDPWRLRLNLLPNEPVTLRSGTQRGAPGSSIHAHRTTRHTAC